MGLPREISTLIGKEIALARRSGSALGGVLLYVASTVFVIYMAFLDVKPTTWLILYWIVLLFAVSNACSASFSAETGRSQLYYYQSVSPQAVLLSKVAFNFGLVALVAVLALGGFSLLLGFPVAGAGLFGLVIVLGVFALTVIFTLMAGISAQTGRSSAILPLLSFPIVIPVIGLLIGASVDAVSGTPGVNFWRNLQLLAAIGALMLALGWVLFPFLWRE